jgi:hypothetical protein
MWVTDAVLIGLLMTLRYGFGVKCFELYFPRPVARWLESGVENL